MDKTLNLKELETQIINCQKCSLCKFATNAVPGEGNPDSDLMFIGEAPGFHEDQQGRPFVGRAGQLLEFMLRQIGYDRKEVWIGNIIKHRPPNNRDPLPEEIAACKPYLKSQIQVINPKIIVTLGRFSMNYFLPGVKISDAHGNHYLIKNKIIYPIYHPAAALRNGAIKTVLLKDFLKIPELLTLDINALIEENMTTNEKRANKEKTEQYKLI